MPLPEQSRKVTYWQSGKLPFILDMRQPEEFRGGHIAGANLISLDALFERMKELPQIGKSFVFVFWRVAAARWPANWV